MTPAQSSILKMYAERDESGRYVHKVYWIAHVHSLTEQAVSSYAIRHGLRRRDHRKGRSGEESSC